MKLSDKLSLYVVCVSIAVFIAITLIVEFYAVKSESEQAEHITKLLQTELVSNLDSRLYSVEQNVKRSAQVIQSYEPIRIKEDAINILKIMLDSDSIMKGCCIAMIPDATTDGREWMEYLHWDGDNLHEMQLGQTDYRYTDRQWYKAPLQSHKGEWSKPYVDKGAGECLMMTYAYPVEDTNGRIFCEVTADIALSDLDEEMHHLIPYKNSYSFTLTKDGRLLEAYPKIPYQQSDKGRRKDFSQFSSALQSGKPILMEGKDYRCTFTPVENIDLVICTASPHTSFTSVTSRIRLPLFLSLVAGFLLLIIILRIALLRAMRPLEKLTQSAINIGNGDFDTEIPKMQQYSDLSQLGNAMEYMKESINKYIVEIEKNTMEREHIATQLKIARGIQRSLLPPAEASYRLDDANLKLTLSAFQESALEVGGDLYDYVSADNRFYFIIADVSGKGIPAALMMSYVKSLFHFAAQQKLQPSEITARINDNMCADNPSNMFVTFQVGYIDIDARKLVIANGGHNPAILSNSSGCRYLQLPAGLPAGIMPDMQYGQHEFPFMPGDTIFMYTDGLSEAENPEGVLYGQDKLLTITDKAIVSLPSTSDIVSSVGEEIMKYSDGKYTDDLTMLCISASDSDRLEIKLKYEISEIATLMSAIRKTGETYHWNEELVNKIMLIAEEAVTNITNHTPTPYPIEEIEFGLRQIGDQVEMIIKDSGPQFNPLQESPKVDPTLPLEERGIGGLGIFLMHQLSHSMEYEYNENKNILKFTLKL